MSNVDPFDAISDPNRRYLLEELRRAPRTVNELAEGLPISRPAVSQHLKVLKQAGIVRDEARGTARIYRIHAPALAELRVWLDSFWDEALDNFKAYAEGEDERR
jgi:DNA-binding transcriptional ArsR family regulator